MRCCTDCDDTVLIADERKAQLTNLPRNGVAFLSCNNHSHLQPAVFINTILMYVRLQP